MNRNIIFWGCGRTAQELYRKYGAEFTLLHGISNNARETVFHTEDGQEFPVKKPENKNGKSGGTIIICSSEYETIAEQLVLLGYIPFVDFMDYEMADILWSGKKIALFYGFCHLRGIAECLKNSKEFSDTYAVVFEPNYLFLNFYRQERLRYLAANCAVFVYGIALTQENYRKNSAILGGLRSNVKTMCLQAAFFGGYFPQSKRAYNAMNALAVKCEGYDYTPFSYGDSLLNDCITQGMLLDDIMERIIHGETYTEDFILKYAEGEWKRLIYQEGECDFKIVEYLKKNYRTKRLFRNETHMENDVLYQYATQILQHLGYSGKAGGMQKPLLNCSQHFIYPCVAKALELEWNVWEEELDLYTYAGWKKVKVEEYIKAYYESCREILRLKKQHMLP